MALKMADRMNWISNLHPKFGFQTITEKLRESALRWRRTMMLGWVFDRRRHDALSANGHFGLCFGCNSSRVLSQFVLLNFNMLNDAVCSTAKRFNWCTNCLFKFTGLTTRRFQIFLISKREKSNRVVCSSSSYQTEAQNNNYVTKFEWTKKNSIKKDKHLLIHSQIAVVGPQSDYSQTTVRPQSDSY